MGSDQLLLVAPVAENNQSSGDTIGVAFLFLIDPTKTRESLDFHSTPPPLHHQRALPRFGESRCA